MAPDHAAGDPVAALREQVERAQEAARRLTEAAAQASGGEPPPWGWQAPPPGGAAAQAQTLLAAAGEAFRSALPPELVERLIALARDLLRLIRALVELLLDRLEARRPPAVEVQDIPIS